MSLDIYLTAIRPTIVFDGNITHNLNKMADEADLYKILWRPDELWPNRKAMPTAADIIGPLEYGLARLKANPEKYRKLNPENGWGDYEGLVKFVEEYLTACRENPDATIEVSR
jgi:hypothetical protein